MKRIPVTNITPLESGGDDETLRDREFFDDGYIKGFTWGFGIEFLKFFLIECPRFLVSSDLLHACSEGRNKDFCPFGEVFDSENKIASIPEIIKTPEVFLSGGLIGFFFEGVNFKDTFPESFGYLSAELDIAEPGVGLGGIDPDDDEFIWMIIGSLESSMDSFSKFIGVLDSMIRSNSGNHCLAIPRLNQGSHESDSRSSVSCLWLNDDVLREEFGELFGDEGLISSGGRNKNVFYGNDGPDTIEGLFDHSLFGDKRLKLFGFGLA